MTARVRRGLARAMACHREGRLAEAERLYGEVIEGDPDNPEGWHLLGKLAYQRGEGKAAARVLQAIRKQPKNPAFHCSLGEILQAQGKAREAALCYREALRLEPGSLIALVNLGIALQSQGQYREACVSYWQAIQRHPECAEAYNNLGNALRGDGRAEEALPCYQEVLRLQPGNPDTAVNVSAVLMELKRPAEAETWARQALERKPGSVAALSNLSMAIKALGRYGEAEALAREALVHEPCTAHLHSNLGSVLLYQKRFAEAETVLRRALELQPEGPEIRTGLASALCGLERLEEGAAQCEAAIRTRPGFVEAWIELALIRQSQGRNPEAMACLDEVLRLQPDNGRAHFARSMSLLLAGHFTAGFAEYEWRWSVLAEKPRGCVGTAWDGSPLDGKTILLCGEQGLGDAIQFARYAPLVAARGGRVVVQVPERLAPLIRTIAGVTDVITPAMPLPPFDEQAPLMSLPRILGTTADTIPGNTPYLQADQQLVACLREALGPAAGLRAGLAWAGNPDHLADRQRSMPLETLKPLGDLAGVEWFSLHIGEKARAEVRQGGWVREILSDSGGVAELAALLSNLDLVISVDSMPAHLAGALARPVWTLLPLAPDWRWQLDRDDTPWYPTMRLFRQSKRGDWGDVVARVCRGIQKMIQGSGRQADKH
jgi:tetratricopeptide (TPR) repeat protein